MRASAAVSPGLCSSAATRPTPAASPRTRRRCKLASRLPQNPLRRLRNVAGHEARRHFALAQGFLPDARQHQHRLRAGVNTALDVTRSVANHETMPEIKPVFSRRVMQKFRLRLTAIAVVLRMVRADVIAVETHAHRTELLVKMRMNLLDRLTRE